MNDSDKREDALRSTVIAVGIRIKAEREKRGWDHIDLVVHSLVNSKTIENLEKFNECNPTLKTLMALADAFQIDVCDLINPSTLPASMTP